MKAIDAFRLIGLTCGTALIILMTIQASLYEGIFVGALWGLLTAFGVVVVDVITGPPHLIIDNKGE